MEAPARVFHQGPSMMLNMAGCSTAVLHLLAQRRQWMMNRIGNEKMMN